MTNKHFIGIEKACRFTRKDFISGESKVIEQSQTTSAFCFDYDQLTINLERELDQEYSNPYVQATPAPSPNGKVHQQELNLKSQGIVKAKEDNLPF